MTDLALADLLATGAALVRERRVSQQAHDYAAATRKELRASMRFAYAMGGHGSGAEAPVHQRTRHEELELAVQVVEFSARADRAAEELESWAAQVETALGDSQ